MIKTYTSAELSNERYHSEEFPQASGSILAEILETSPAEYIGRERKETAAMNDGTSAHCCILEPKRFKETYVRGIDPADYPDALEGNKMLEAWLKERGVKCSGKTKAELLGMIDSTGETPQILQRVIDKHNAESADAGLSVVSPSSYDMIIKMRSALKKGGYVFTPEMKMEISFIGERLKCRMDTIVPPGEMAPDGVISKNGEIWDYKTTLHVNPRKFATEAITRGYWLKMAIQSDLFEEEYGNPPDRVVLLAQSKKGNHYLPQAYSLDSQQLEAGREDYRAALGMLDICKSTNVWFGYGGGVIPLPTPGWAAYERGFEDTIEIIEE